MPSSSSSNSGSVEVLAPPGLEFRSQLIDNQPPTHHSPPIAPSSAVGPIGPSATPKPESYKDELVREVTAAVREDIEWKTAAAVDNLWQKGQRAMQHLQEQHTQQTQLLQSQLAACADAHQQLQRENAMLRSGLEALMKHLTMVFGAPPLGPCMPPPGVLSPSGGPPVAPPTLPPVCTPTSAATVTPPPTSPSPFFPTPPAPKPQKVDVPDSKPENEPAAPSAAHAGVSPSTEDFHTPRGSPVPGAPSAADELNAAIAKPAAGPGIPGFPHGASSCGGTGSENPSLQNSPTPSAATQSSNTQPEVASFSLTLRRADNVPLGLEVLGEPESEYLLVESIRSGGAVEAWNRQCHGDAREIRAGDRILKINKAKGADAMRKECAEKHLLRLSVVRGPFEGQASSRAASTTSGAGSVALGPVSLRAEADEFVPQGRPSATP